MYTDQPARLGLTLLPHFPVFPTTGSRDGAVLARVLLFLCSGTEGQVPLKVMAATTTFAAGHRRAESQGVTETPNRGETLRKVPGPHPHLQTHLHLPLIPLTVRAAAEPAPPKTSQKPHCAMFVYAGVFARTVPRKSGGFKEIPGTGSCQEMPAGSTPALHLGGLSSTLRAMICSQICAALLQTRLL